MAIRYDSKLNREIARVVKNFNAKVMRLQGVERSLAPETILVSDLKKEFTRRSELMIRLRELELFSKRGMEEEVKIGVLDTTRYELELDKRRAARVKRNLSREINKENRGEKKFNTAYIRNLKKHREFLDRPISSLSKKMLEIRQHTIKREMNVEKKRNTLYNNMFSMIYKTAFTAGLDPEFVERVLATFRKLTPAQLADAFDTMPIMNLFSLRYNAMERVGEGGPSQVAEVLQHMVDSVDNIAAFYAR